MPAWLIQIIIGLVLNVVAYILLGAAQKPKPEELKDQEQATAEAGRPIMLVSGSGTISGLNIIEAWDKEAVRRSISAGGKK
jgi:hypothetical protein